MTESDGQQVGLTLSELVKLRNIHDSQARKAASTLLAGSMHYSSVLIYLLQHATIIPINMPKGDKTTELKLNKYVSGTDTTMCSNAQFS